LGEKSAFESPILPAVDLSTCRAQVVDDPRRRTLCADTATMRVERGDSLQTQALGTTIGERAGWPAERVAALKAAAGADRRSHELARRAALQLRGRR